VQLLAQQFDAAELRAAEMETELAAAQDRAARHDNESQSLQTSLDLAMAENARLSQRLELSDCALEDACAELARQQAACAKATGERSKLAGEVFAANGKRLNETTELKDQLETMSARALTAERLLTDARECLQARITENGVTERSLAEMTAARRDADNQIKQQQDLLCVKQCQLNELDQSRQELVAAMNALLKACQNRETALTQAEDKIEALTGRIAQLEAEAREASRQLAQTQAQLRAEQRRRPATRRVATAAADEKARINWAELASEFAKLVKLKGQVTEPRPASSPTALLASTITF
jgi:septal ring factor EnvC (AmiA/AmiB activator)